MSNKPQHIEELLNCIGSRPIQESTKHRYELRRALLCSRLSDELESHTSQRKWFYAIPLFAGSFLIVMLVVVVSPAQESSVGQTDSDFISQTSTQISDSIFINSNNLVAKYIDDRNVVPVTREKNIVSISTASLVYSQ